MIREKEDLKARGMFFMQVLDAKTGIVLQEYRKHNLVVALGKTNIAKLIAGDATGTKVNKVSFGTNATDPASTDTAIQNAFTKALDGYSYPAANQVMFTWSLASGEANGMLITELGLITDAGTLFARKVRSAVTKTASIRLVGTWTITIN